MTTWDVRWLPECGSTMVEARTLARAGAPEGLVVVADHQTAGRGRLDRRWEAPPGASLLCSILVRPEAPSHRDTLRVALAASQAVVAATQGAVRPLMKWPNDLLLDLPDVGERKLAGVLAEAEQDDLGWAVVVGIGLNVGWPPRAELPPELADVVGAVSDATDAVLVPTRQQVLDSLLASLDLLLATGVDDLVALARRECCTIGRDVRVSSARADAADVVGTAVDLTEDGALVVEAGGERHAFLAGDVVHVRPAGPAPGGVPGAH